MSIIQSIDFFGSTFTPTIGNSSKQKTTLGGVLAILYFGFSLYIFYSFGKVLIYFDTPFQTQEIQVDSENKFNLSLAIGLYCAFHPLINPLRSAAQEAKYLAFLNDNVARERFTYNINLYRDKETGEETIIPTRNCTSYDFGGNLNSADQGWVNKSICFDTEKLSMLMYKKVGDPRTKYPYVSFQSCENNTKFRKYANDCLSYEDQDYYLKNYEIRTYILYSGASYNISNPTNALSKYLDNFYSKFVVYSGAQHLKMVNFIDVRQIFVRTDIGYFTNSIIEEKLQEFEKINYAVGGYTVGQYYDNTNRKIYLEFIFYSSKNTVIMNRSYPKVQDVIANAGGVMGLVAFAIQNFLQVIYDSKAKELLIHQIFYLHDQEDSAKIVKVNNKQLENNKGNKAETKIQIVPSNQSLEIGNLSNSNNIIIANNSIKDLIPPNSSQNILCNTIKVKNKFRKSSFDQENKKSTARVNILETKDQYVTKTKYTPLLEERVPLSVFDHFILSYFCCFICGRLKKISNHYKEVEEIVSSYTDILNIVQNSFEMEKLKYLLMDEDQVAIFNLRSKLSFDKEASNSSEFSKFYYFCKDLNDNVKTEQIKQELKERQDQQRFNSRLIDLDNNLAY